MSRATQLAGSEPAMRRSAPMPMPVNEDGDQPSRSKEPRAPAASMFAFVAVLVAGCGGSPPVVALAVTQAPNTAPIRGLAQLRLDIMECGADTPLLRTQLDPSQKTLRAEAELQPGTTFYAWLLGFIACAEGTPCLAEDAAGPADCICQPAGPPLRRAVEGCTPWLEATQDTTVNVMVGNVAGLCPPGPSALCEAP